MVPANILVVEDEPDLAELLVHVLRDEGYRVHSAENGVIAIAVLAREPVDLLLTDISMPVMGGIELIQTVGENPRLRGLPILVLSALPERMVRGRCSVIAGFVQKPFQVRKLMAQIEALLTHRVSLPSGSEG